MIVRIGQIWQPLWRYLNQPLCDPHTPAVWHPQRFWYVYKVELLERCWQKDSASQSHNHQ